MTERLLAASTTTLDRLLIAVRSLVASRHNLRRGRQLTVRTFTGWNRPPAGFLEIDPVARCGESIGGSSVYSLVATGVCNSWTEAVPLLASEQPLLVSGLERNRQTAAPSRPRDGLRQRQRVHQRHLHPILRRPGRLVHPLSGVTDE